MSLPFTFYFAVYRGLLHVFSLPPSSPLSLPASPSPFPLLLFSPSLSLVLTLPPPTLSLSLSLSLSRPFCLWDYWGIDLTGPCTLPWGRACMYRVKVAEDGAWLYIKYVYFRYLILCYPMQSIGMKTCLINNDILVKFLFTNEHYIMRSVAWVIARRYSLRR